MVWSEWDILVSILSLQSIFDPNQKGSVHPSIASLGSQIRVDPNSPINWINPEMIVFQVSGSIELDRNCTK